jgi:hypothetical protein
VAGFTYIVEPFDPGHPAQQRSTPANCGTQTSTLAIEQCYEARAENATDSPSIANISWFTAPDGSRIGMQATQGDAHGGAIVAWTIIGGGQGFTVTPAQFLFRDGSFTDGGVTGPSSPAGHRVAAGTVYVTT